MAPQVPGFDTRKAHHYFAASCFNKAWELIEKPDRTPADDEEMVRLSQASIYHWTQREDFKQSNLSIGYWQASRIHAILGRGDEGRRYGQLCLQSSPEEEPFLRAYAYEALSRAERVAGNLAVSSEHRDEAMRIVNAVEDEEDRKALLADLETVGL